MTELIEVILEFAIITLSAALIVLIGFVLIQSAGRIIENEIIAKMIKKHVQDRRWKRCIGQS